jgi:RPA family protein
VSSAKAFVAGERQTRAERSAGNVNHLIAPKTIKKINQRLLKYWILETL